jgi:hypothetical protein
MQAEQRFRDFKKDWEQAIAAPGSQLRRGTNQVGRLRELLEAAIGNRIVGGEEPQSFSMHSTR